MTVQPIGEPPEAREHLGKRCTPKYFLETFFLPWPEKAVERNNYNGKQLVEDLQNEIKRLDLLKVDRKKVGARNNSISSENTKCVSKNCIYKGLNTSNKEAVGVCAKCGNW